MHDKRYGSRVTRKDLMILPTEELPSFPVRLIEQQATTLRLFVRY